jgi:hypothetical protein
MGNFKKVRTEVPKHIQKAWNHKAVLSFVGTNDKACIAGSLTESKQQIWSTIFGSLFGAILSSTRSAKDRQKLGLFGIALSSNQAG